MKDATDRTISPDKVEIVDEFWAPRLDTTRTVTLPDVFDKFEKQGAFGNFDRVRDGKRGNHVGPPWYDGLIYETMRAASDFLAIKYEEDLDIRLDGYIERIAAAADRDPDGYIATWTSLEKPEHRWGENGGSALHQHDVYNAGCLVEAAVHHYRATGKTSLLEIAVRYADYMCNYMGPPPRHNVIPAHSLPEEALVKLYGLFREFPELHDEFSPPPDERKYLNLARFWIDTRGNHNGRGSFGAYAQDHKPVLEQDEIVGHAVRASLMCTGLIAVATATGEPEYHEAAVRLWESAVCRKMHITGGAGSLEEGEQFGPDYLLPDDGYLETCAAVGMGFFHHGMNMALADGRYADELERVLYNNVLNGVSLKGDTYFYENPLMSKDRKRWRWHDCPCCPPMLLKIMAALPSCIYAYDRRNIYVNLFVGSCAETVTAGTAVRLAQETRYPWDGAIRLIVSPDKPAEFTVNIRIPGWAVGKENPGDLYRSAMENERIVVKVNGGDITLLQIDRGYARIRRAWKAEDVIELNLPMGVRRVYAHPEVKNAHGRVALQRGPFVYCLESVDNSGLLESYSLAADSPLTAKHRPDLLRGITVVGGTATAKTQTSRSEKVQFTAIPFYAQNNRQPGAEMRVWLRESGA
jgi:DUF1680 family protein